jgi:hypothetical protein
MSAVPFHVGFGKWISCEVRRWQFWAYIVFLFCSPLVIGFSVRVFAWSMVIAPGGFIPRVAAVLLGLCILASGGWTFSNLYRLRNLRRAEPGATIRMNYVPLISFILAATLAIGPFVVWLIDGPTMGPREWRKLSDSAFEILLNRGSSSSSKS